MGTPTSSETAFANHAVAAMTNPDARERWIRSRVAFLNVMTEIIADWKELSELSPPGGADSAEVLARTKAIREHQRVTLTAASLNALGVISHSILEEATSSDVDQAKLEDELRARLEPFRQVNRERTAAIWQANLMVDERIRTQTPAIRAAATKLIELPNAD